MSVGVGFEAFHLGVAVQGDVAVAKGRSDAEDVGVGLAVCEAGEAVESVAANAASRLRVGLVQVDADGHVKRMLAGLLEVVAQLLDEGLVRHGRMGEGARAWRLGRILPGLSMDQVDIAIAEP